MDSDKLSVSRTIGSAIKAGWKVVAAVRGMAFTQDKAVKYYIDVVAESPDQQEQYDIGFWPGINKDYSVTEKDLAEIKALHPTVKVKRNVARKQVVQCNSDLVEISNG